MSKFPFCVHSEPFSVMLFLHLCMASAITPSCLVVRAISRHVASMVAIPYYEIEMGS